jgi:palmitoyltransferase
MSRSTDSKESLEAQEEPLIEPPSPTSSLKPAQETINAENDFLIEKYVEACQKGDIVTVKELIETDAVELGNDVDSKGVSGLHWAAINNRLSIVKYLVEKGAEVDKEGGEIVATPLHWACRYGLVYIVDYLLKKGADPSKADSQGYNALHLAVHSSNIMLIIYILVTCEIDIDVKDPNGRTALHWASYQGDALSVDVLLKFRASVKAVDSQGFIPLHWALIRGQKDCLRRLIEEGSDPEAKTSENKTCFDVAADMNNIGAFKQALFEAGFLPNGEPLKKYFDEKWAKVITFFYPYLVLGVLMKIIAESHVLVSLVAVLATFFISLKLLKNYLLPCYIRSSHPFLNSPLLAGVFSGSAFWIAIVWITTLLPKTLTEAPLTNLIFLISTSSTIYSFQRSMFKDPGVIEAPDTPKEIESAIQELLSTGKYDAKHFCINTFNRKPLRSKYSQFSKKLIARFDHTCPWVYNDVGLRNHKIFVFFVISLEISIISTLALMLELFDVLEDDDLQCAILESELCAGLTYAPFIFVLGCWTAFQGLWLTFLLFSQCFQITKGVTTLELSNLTKFNDGSNRNSDYSSAPAELLGTDTLDLDRSGNRPQKKCWTTMCLLLGLDQFAIALKQTLGIKDSSTGIEIPADYGIKQNCLDFWLAPGEDSLKFRNLFKMPVKGEANLNGVPVDYYTLYKLPPKRPTYEAV